MRRVVGLGVLLGVLLLALVGARFSPSIFTYSAPVSFPPGTAAAPSITSAHVGSDGGIYFPPAGMGSQQAIGIVPDNGLELVRFHAFGIMMAADNSADLGAHDGSRLRAIHIRGAIHVGAGTAQLPTVVADADGDTGLWWPGTDVLGIAVRGFEALRLHLGGIMAPARDSFDIGLLQGAGFRHAHLSGTVHVSGLLVRSSTSALPAIADSQNTTTGLAFPAANQLTVSVSAVEILRIHARGLMTGERNTQDLGLLEGSGFRHAHLSGTIHAAAYRVSDSLEAAPSITGQGSTTTGLFWPATSTVGISIAGASGVVIHAGGLMAGINNSYDIGTAAGSRFRNMHLTGGLTISPAGTADVGLVINAPSGSSATAFAIRYNGTTNHIRAFALATSSQIALLGGDYTNNVAGPLLAILPNTNPGGAEGAAAGTLGLYRAAGSTQVLWTDATGLLRTNTAAPTGSAGTPTVSDTAGTIVGTQSSRREWKQILGHPTPAEGLDLVLRTPISRFLYRLDAPVPHIQGEEFVGIIAQDSPWFAMDRDPIDGIPRLLNPINSLGYTVLAIQAQEATIRAQRAEIEDLKERLLRLEARMNRRQ